MEEKELTLQDTIDKNVEALWKEFQNVPVDRNGNLRAAWKAYPKGTNKHVSCWDKDKRDSGNCFRNYNGNYTEREENMENFNFNVWLREMLHR